MNFCERLQRAVELTVTAGYHLDKEAFDFLNEASVTIDPVEIVRKALAKIESLKEKPLFIERSLLEEIAKKPKGVESSHPEQKMKATLSPQV
ncbi:MAG: hypothetical protein QXW17_03305, partial [Candidatus Bathyarchaeia archaeon]